MDCSNNARNWGFEEGRATTQGHHNHSAPSFGVANLWPISSECALKATSKVEENPITTGFSG